ncbi:hypothetical protein DPMN_129879 [Dreissena polymorpha]|uniref:DZIP3-like HEPN domain-containing protein n=1 Tax=Dreissena polymorpha TaxID=45954 RepID=A0A9D4H3J3_DREPO|nr:hypothetical protein DPMN_129879 [Dreissena polymorpha]
MASIDGNQNEAYYLRLHMLVMEAQKVLRAKFDSIIKPAQLTSTLKGVQKTIDQLNKRGKITNEQYNSLYPKSPNPNPNSETFDITLLVCLLRNICNLNPNSKVWTEKDNTKIKGYTDQENILRIRNLRNKVSTLRLV